MRNDLNNPQAFPGLSEGDFPGMTLRDYFAAKAISGLLVNFNQDCVRKKSIVAEEMSELAYVFADAMLAERMKP